MTIKELPINRSWSKRGLFVLLVLFAAVFWVMYPTAHRQLALGQNPLTDVYDIETLRAQFNHDVGQTRLIILLSPT
jgi:hypothetical protein